MEEEDAATATLELARRGAAVHRLGEAEAGVQYAVHIIILS